jgi:hypothetical protein
MVSIPRVVQGLLSLLVVGLAEAASPLPLFAQTATTYPVCPSPGAGEYLLLIASQSPASLEQVQRSLPPNAPATVCRYLDQVVTRVGGFGTVDLASAWAKYITETVGTPVFIAQPPTGTQAAIAPVSSTKVTPSATEYKPQPLAGGYAVLVDFASRPEVAAQIQQAIGLPVGLVSYRQRPYLLALATPDQAAATTLMQTLTARGFSPLLVEGQQVMVLRSVIDPQRAASN